MRRAQRVRVNEHKSANVFSAGWSEIVPCSRVEECLSHLQSTEIEILFTQQSTGHCGSCGFGVKRPGLSGQPSPDCESLVCQSQWFVLSFEAYEAIRVFRSVSSWNLMCPKDNWAGNVKGGS